MQIFSIAGTLPFYLMKVFIISSILFFPSNRGFVAASQLTQTASEDAIRRRTRELEQNDDGKRDMLRKMLEIKKDRGEKVNFTNENIANEAMNAL